MPGGGEGGRNRSLAKLLGPGVRVLSACFTSPTSLGSGGGGKGAGKVPWVQAVPS